MAEPNYPEQDPTDRTEPQPQPQAQEPQQQAQPQPQQQPAFRPSQVGGQPTQAFRRQQVPAQPAQPTQPQPAASRPQPAQPTQPQPTYPQANQAPYASGAQPQAGQQGQFQPNAQRAAAQPQPSTAYPPAGQVPQGQAGYRPQATQGAYGYASQAQQAAQPQPQPQPAGRPYQTQPQPQQTQPQPQAQSAAAQPQAAHAPKTPKVEGNSFVKSLVGGFVGALIAVLIVLGATGNLFPSSTSGSTTVLGGSGNSSISAVSEDATLPEAVAAKTLPSVVCIYVYSQQSSGYGWMGGGTVQETLSSLGSGVILSEEGHIITNYHVIEGESSLKVSLNGEQYDASVVGTDPSSDLAVIKVEGASNLTPIEIGSSADLVVGEWVMTVGAPYGMEQSVGSGIVSAVSRSSASLQSTDSTAVYANLIQTDAPINPGNSGGALVDSDGKLVGINTLTASYSGTNSGVGFAIPVDYAASIAQQIISGQGPSHAQLGVSLVTIDSATARRYSLSAEQGAYVSRVYSGAAEAGIQEGDIITKIDGKSMTSATDVILAVRSHMPGDTVNVEVNRNGEIVSMDVTLSSDNVSQQQ